jgi:murein DD-endopeptidase MepM/ murein hydrolase activator NlpD
MSAETGASIVAAADGIIAYVQDSFVITCPSSEWKGNCADYTGPAGEANCCIRGTPGCNCRNNYIWISHPNGEWTKYTHIQQNSVPFELVPGTPVTAGTILGKEGDVGAATPCDACTDGSHLHFEVARPDRVNTDLKPDNPNYDPLGIDPGNCGTCGIPSVSDEDKDDIVNNANRQNRIPNFCQTGFLKAGETYTATGCDGACINDSETQKGTVADDKIFYTQTTDLITNQSNVYTVNAGAGVAWRAGNRIRLTSGFTASDGSYFSASIGSCDSPAAP